jgi:hypothetical protein
MRTAIDIVEAYLYSLEKNLLGQAPLAPDVTYEGPTVAKCEGNAVAEYLATVAADVRGLRIRQHIVEGPYVASIVDLETSDGAVTMCDCFRISNGLIKEIRAFYGPAAIARVSPRAEGGGRR